MRAHDDHNLRYILMTLDDKGKGKYIDLYSTSHEQDTSNAHLRH